MAETEPPHEIQEVIQAMTLARGYVINSFAQVECRLADLIDQCQMFDEYAEINAKQLPFGVGSRISRVRELIASGPLARHAEAIERLLVRLGEFEEVRHLFTHGYASFVFTPKGDMGMQFVRYVPPAGRGQVFTVSREFYRLDTMRRQQESSTAFAEEALTTLRKVYAAAGLDPDRLSKLASEVAQQ